MAKNILHKFFRRLHIPSYLLAMTIVVLSSMKLGNTGNQFYGQDKVMHFVVFGLLAFSLCLWVRRRRWRTQPWRYGIIIVCVVAAFGALDEFHQSFVPGRQVSFYDWLADLLGGVVVTSSYVLLKLWEKIPLHWE